MPHAPSVSFYTLGCRLNQSETAILCNSFQEKGYTVKAFGDTTDVCVINTCSVTGQSEARCRNIIRSVLRKHPQTFLIVIGCYVQVGLGAIRAIPGIDMIVGTEQKFQIAELLDALTAPQRPGMAPPKQPEPIILHSEQLSKENFTIASAGSFVRHTRANIKIQDGCNFFCSYCIVPYTRGRDRSREFEDIRREAQELAQRGHQEIVITGVNIGTYSYEGRTFLDVVKMLEEIEGVERIRITSIEPMTIPEGLIDYAANSPKLCHFFHVPVQSGDNTMLSRMNRRYTREEFTAFVQNLVERIPDVHVGTDIIVGFPGEGEAEFEQSRRLLDDLPLTYAHVFSFSPRAGTRAATFSNQVTPDVIKQRSQILRDLSRRNRQRAYAHYLGRTVRVLFEQREKSGFFTGYTGNYMKVGVPVEADLSNQFHEVRIIEVREKLAVGELISDCM